MAYIVPAKGARHIARRVANKGLDIFTSHHLTVDRVPDRLKALVSSQADLDKWMVATIYRALIEKTALTVAPKAFYKDGSDRVEENCFYAVSEVAPGHTVCLVFAREGSEVVIITVLRPLNSDNSYFHRSQDRKRVAVAPLNAGGMDRKLPAHRRQR